MILVTGAAGMVGTAMLNAFAKEGLATRAFIHKESDRDHVLRSGANEVFIGNMENAEDIRQALSGVDTVYHICSAVNPAETIIGEKMIAAAKEKGSIYFLYHSVLHSILPELPHHQKKMQVEQNLIASGIPYTIIQPAVFMQTLMPAVMSVKNDGPLLQKFFTGSQTHMNLVDVTDVAEAVAKIIKGKNYYYSTLQLAGPKNLSLQELISSFETIAKRELQTAFISDEDFIRHQNYSPDSYQVQTLMTMFEHYNQSGFYGNSYMLSHILGREPNKITDFLAKTL